MIGREPLGSGDAERPMAARYYPIVVATTS